MAEQIYKSPGVFTREIDTSQPSAQGISGVPAGIIGTADLGPAFVPMIFGNISSFVGQFGNIDGSSFGRIAAQEYLSRGGSAITYIRVLGIGDGKQKNSDGSVTNAGFFTGNRLVQSEGDLGDNTYANSGVGAVEGRTYFLGCFMSESNGSTIFSDAGIQSPGPDVKASITLAIDFAGLAAHGDTVTNIQFVIPTAAGGEHDTNPTEIKIDEGQAGGAHPASTDMIGIGAAGDSDADIAGYFINAVNGVFSTEVVAATGGVGTAGVRGVTATANGSTGVNLEIDIVGSVGNLTNAVTLDSGGGPGVVKIRSFTGGERVKAVPILRGVLLAPSGVMISLSGSHYNGGAATQKPLTTTTATTADGVLVSRYGQLTGSIKMANSGEFVMLLNGFNGAENIITASFDVTSKSYLGSVLNRNPLDIEKKGHYLHASYDIYPTFATITGSGVVGNGISADYENIGFILTGSNTRGQSSSLNNKPDYEDWQDRFTHAESPYIVSQDLGARYDLFKLIALSPGEEFSKKYKFSIFNINKADKTFSITIRERSDTDSNAVRIQGETYNGLSLDPNNDRYIGRVIGDLNIRYDFDTSDNSQKIIVEGTHKNQSNLVRVKVSTDLESGNIPSTALPFGFRGIMHTVTSGSMLSGASMGDYSSSDILNRVLEPPVQFRENVSTGQGLSKSVSTDLFWGIQTELKTNILEPNKIDNTLTNIPDVTLGHVTHFPTHRTDTTAFAVRDNTGTADVNGSILDVDRFNNNLFVLENIQVRTGSEDDYQTRADPEQWVSASYVRKGSIVSNAANKTRALTPNDLDIQANGRFIKFTCLFQGGFNGTNIFDQQKYNLTNVAAKREYDNAATQGGVKSGPTINAYRKALDIIGSKTDVDIQLLSVPGLRNRSVTDYAIDVAENRFDCLYIMDLEEKDSENKIITGSSETPSVTYTVRNLINRSLDSSFAAAYFPDVNAEVALSDGSSITKRLPPSSVVLGAYANNDSIGQSWFAPAGKNRGILPSVTSTSLGVMTRASMDDLYEADINPIQVEDGSGITIQGQKTLLKSLSALDRVNVRRLLINIRRAVRNISNSLIFEPNRKETLDKFRSRVNPVLEAIKSQGGVSRYKVVIDNTTTTQADIENNTVRGKIYIQPVRVAEFIALDFNITNQIVD